MNQCKIDYILVLVMRPMWKRSREDQFDKSRFLSSVEGAADIEDLYYVV
jgi:hypothetical protein